MTEIINKAPQPLWAGHHVSYNYKTVPMTSWKDQGLNANHLSIKFH